MILGRMVLAMAGAFAVAWPVLLATPAMAAPAQTRAPPDRLPCDLPRQIGIDDVRSHEGTGSGLTTFVLP
ncbi:hypothetical protein KIPE111705_32685 [Kibdelosporangium persicum]|uniref:hypothetical protein n=1 Tax=Kibdelosporangium persicum TaxID=2698649 RepID=UPI0015672328|nr:hypothetical protein [Kibdelosporangium persicum]